MTRPYLALTWPRACEPGGHAAVRVGRRLLEAGWRDWTSRPGLAVWERPERPLPTPAAPRGAVIVGRRFAHEETPEGEGAHANPATSVLARARVLNRDGWGAYLALLHDPGADRWWLFRDPSGALPVFTWRLGPLAICASGLEAAPPGLLPAKLGLDWNVIAECLRDPGGGGGRTALAGIEWVAPGDLQPAGGSAWEAHPIWRPADWVPRGEKADPDWGIHLRRTLRRTVGAMVGPYARVATEASGGLDSSIVNAAIACAGLGDRVVAALHYVGDRPEADERRWAGELCSRWGLPLACVERAHAHIDFETDFGDLCRDVRPPLAALDSARDRDTAARLRACGAQALVTGKGGDALFFQMPTPAVLADLWRSRGAAAIRDPVNGQVARWLRRSLWSAWREAFFPRPAEDGPAFNRFAGWMLRDAQPTSTHPWLADLEDLPPAKQIQIRALANGQLAQGVYRRSRAADLLHPLLAQPMMELCLAIPSWELVRGGRDRGLAREAFAAWLPPSVAQRRSKGGLGSWYARLIAANAPALREHLLDGVLANAGLLDGAAIDAALEPDDLIRTGDAVDLMAAAALESWVRYWQTRVADAPGAERYQP